MTVILTAPRSFVFNLNRVHGFTEVIDSQEGSYLVKTKISFASLEGGSSFFLGIIPLRDADPIRYKSLNVYRGKILLDQLSIQDIISQERLVFGRDTVIISQKLEN